VTGGHSYDVQNFHLNQQVSIQTETLDHPITSGVTEFEIQDETYVTQEPDEDCILLLSTDHKPSTRAIGWISNR
jgi:hypothetical protein